MSLDTMKEIALAAENDLMRVHIKQLETALQENTELLLNVDVNRHTRPDIRFRIVRNTNLLFHLRKERQR